MTSVLPEEENKAARLKQKLINDAHIKEETRSFLRFSRGSLSLSHSDLEQGFNKNRFRLRGNAILSTAALIVALLCLGLEMWTLHCSLVNAREIREMRRDVDGMKHRFLKDDLLDELKAFEEQLYAEEPNDEDDPTEENIDNADYDLNYDDVSSSHDYSDDYHTLPTYGSRPSDFPDAGSTIEPVPSPPEPTSDKSLVEILAALRKGEAKRGQEFEKNMRGGHKSAERDRSLQEGKKKVSHEEKGDKANGTKQKRDVSEDARRASLPLDLQRIDRGSKRKRSVNERASHGSGELAPSSHRRANHNQTRRMIVSRARAHENAQDDVAEGNQTGSINSWDRHPPKKYYAHARPDASHTLPPARQDDLAGQPTRANKRLEEDVEVAVDRRLDFRDDRDDAREDISETYRALEISESASKQTRRAMTRRHLRAPRQVYAVHYGADSTLFSEEDEHTGNGRARHADGVFKAWRPSDWVSELGMGKHFSLARDGRLTVHESGLYLAYAQIHYLDEHDENGFHLLVNGRPILQCMIYSPGVGHKSRSCFSAQVTLLHAGDVLILKDVGSARYTLFQHDKSFFGLVKLGETRQQQRHQVQQPSQ